MIPAQHGWNIVRSADRNGTWDVVTVADLTEAAAALTPGEDFVLGLPLNSVLAQRMQLPTVEEQDFREMVRIQVEKALPYPPDEITSDYELIEESGTDSVISSVAVHNPKLSELAAPLLLRGCIPHHVTVYAAQRAATHAREGRALLIYPEGEKLVSAISENAKITFTRTLEGATPEQLQIDLPQLALSAELQGISSAFPLVLLDEKCIEARQAVETTFALRPELVGVEAPPAHVKLNLLPAAWRELRKDRARRAEWKQRLIWAGLAYAAVLVLFVAYLGVLRFQLHRLSKSIGKDAPKVEFVRNVDKKWKALAPAIDPRYYPIELLLNLFKNLPSPDVHITQYNQSARQVSIDGEASSVALAYQFAEKVKKAPELQAFQFQMGAPRILPNEHAQFRLEGKPK